MANIAGLSARQKSVRYYLPESESLPKAFTDFYTDMFIKDVSVGMMPIGGNSRRDQFSISVRPSDPSVEAMIASALQTFGHEQDLKASMSEFFRLLAAEVCAMDRAVYEVVYLENAQSATVGFELVYIDDAQIKSKGGQLYQHVPEEVAQREGVSTMISLPDESVLVFKAPATLQKAIRDTRVSLMQLNDLALSSFASTAFQSKIPYDYALHRQALEVALATATRDVGWTARGLFRERTLSYYEVHMHLIFERFKLGLRDAFLSTLNEGLRRIGARMNFKAQVEVSGLPTKAEIDLALEELKTGSKAFTLLMEPFLRY